MAKRFYNGGDKFEASILFSTPNASGDSHSVGRKILIFPKESFVEVEDEIEAGLETIRVNFSADLLRNYGRRGLVLIDKKHDAEKEDPEKELPAKAPSDELAIARAKQLWHDYTFAVVQAHLQDCDAARAAGGAPRYARDFTKHCLKLHKIADPADRYMDSLKEGAKGPDVDGGVIAMMQQQLAQTNALLHALLLSQLTGKPIDKEVLENLAAQTSANGGSTPGRPIISGVATGQTKPEKPGRDNGLQRNSAKGKAHRQRQAEAALET